MTTTLHAKLLSLQLLKQHDLHTHTPSLGDCKEKVTKLICKKDCLLFLQVRYLNYEGEEE